MMCRYSMFSFDFPLTACVYSRVCWVLRFWPDRFLNYLFLCKMVLPTIINVVPLLFSLTAFVFIGCIGWRYSCEVLWNTVFLQQEGKTDCNVQFSRASIQFLTNFTVHSLASLNFTQLLCFYVSRDSPHVLVKYCFSTTEVKTYLECANFRYFQSTSFSRRSCIWCEKMER